METGCNFVLPYAMFMIMIVLYFADHIKFFYHSFVVYFWVKNGRRNRKKQENHKNRKFHNNCETIEEITKNRKVHREVSNKKLKQIIPYMIEL